MLNPQGLFEVFFFSFQFFPASEGANTALNVTKNRGHVHNTEEISMDNDMEIFTFRGKYSIVLLHMTL